MSIDFHLKKKEMNKNLFLDRMSPPMVVSVAGTLDGEEEKAPLTNVLY